MLQIPTIATPSQTLVVQLGSQFVQINIYQKFFGLFMDVLLSGNGAFNNIVNGTLCLNLNYIIRSAYFGFSGDLTWVDNQGTNDPYYTGLGSRYSLLYLTEDEIPPPTSTSTYSD